MRTRIFSDGWRLIFTPRALAPFLLGSLALSILGNAGYQLLTNWFGTGSWAVGGVLIGSVLVLMLTAWILSRLVNRLRPFPPLANKRPPEKRKGLILLISSEEIARQAVAWHHDRLKYCWLFFSSSEKSTDAANKLRDELIADGKKVEMVFINDVLDPVEYQAKVERIYSGLPSDCLESDLILDFTGMTACASVGSVLACLNEKRPIQYTPARYDTALKAMQPLDPVEVVLHWGLLRPPPASNVQTNLAAGTFPLPAETSVPRQEER